MTPDSVGPDFAGFVAERQRGLLRFATVLSSDSRVAEDIVSDVLGRTFEQWDRIRVMADPNAYVRRMVANEYLTLRRRWRRTRSSPDARPRGDTIPDPSIAYAVNWLEQNAPDPSGPAPDQVTPSPRSQSRPRRRRAGVLVLAAAVVALAATLVPVLVHHDESARPTPNPRRVTQFNSATVTPSSTPAVTAANIPAVMPSTYLAHLPGQSGAGPIGVYDLASGTLLRTLGTVADPYPQNGFQVSADHRTLYYVRLNEPTQTVEIVSVPVAGGPTTVLADGTRPTPSPDGKGLAYLASDHRNEIAVMTLAGPSTAYLVNVELRTWAELRQPTGSTWRAVEPLPGAALPDAVLVTRDGGTPSHSAAISIIDLSTSQIVATHVAPSGQLVAAADLTGDFILLSGAGGTTVWQPGTGGQTHIGPAMTSGPSELTW